jgi:hypothetical protein
MSIAAAIHATPEPLKVFTGAIGAISASLAGVNEFLQFILYLVMIAYTAVKLINAWRRGQSDREE